MSVPGRLPPQPDQGDLRNWARQLVDYIINKERSADFAVQARPVQLQHITGGEKAFVDGLVMWDVTNGIPVYSKAGQWHKFSDDTAV